MKISVVFVASLLALVGLSSPAAALTLPDVGYYFTGTTEELHHIRAGIAHLAGYEAEAWTFPSAYTYEHNMLSPAWLFGMGEVDCLRSYYAPNQGPFEGSEDYLGLSTTVIVNGVPVGVEIPALEDLVTRDTMPGECFGYLFATMCAYDPFWGPLQCPDPE